MDLCKSSKVLKCFAIVVLCIVSYGDQLDGDFVFDDSVAIVNNKLVSRTTNVLPWWDVFSHDYWGTPILSPTSHKSYRPLTTLTFRLEYAMHGSPFWMKLWNLVLHTIISCLVVFFGDIVIRDHCRTSFLAGVLFAVHPVHVEAVSGIVSRSDLLATLCCILAVTIYFKAFIEKEISIKIAVLSMAILTTLGVLFKETGITMLFTCAALDILYNTNVFPGSSKLQDWREIPWRRILVLCLTAVVYIVFRFLMGAPTFQLEDNPFALIEDRIFRILNHVFLHSINAWLLICPNWLSFDWSMGSIEIISSWSDYRLVGVLAYLLCFTFIWIKLCSMKDRRRRNQITAALALLIIPFLPASGIVHVGFVIAERLLYMPSIGWCLATAYGFRRLLGKCHSNASKSVLKIVFLSVILIFVLKTRSRAADWKHEHSLYQSALRVCPNNAKVHYNIAKKSDPGTAIVFYKKAISLYPDYDAALMNLGNLYRDRGDLDMAESYLRKALDSTKITDKRAAAEMNLGIVLVMRKQFTTALRHYNNALQARPYYPVCYYNMGNAYVELKQFDVAQKNFETALALDRTMTVAWKNLLTLLYNEGKYEDLIRTADEAIAILPNEVELQFPKANALAKLHLNSDAEQVFLHLIDKRPSDAVFHANLGVLYHHWKKYDRAAEYYEKALALNPQLERIRGALDKVTRMNSNQMQ